MTAHAGDEAANFPCVTIVLHDTQWDHQELVAKKLGLREAVEELCYGCLEQTHPTFAKV